jgi:hypothetical protein
MAFQITPLRIPNLTPDFSAENQAFSRLGATLGNLIPEMRKEQLDARKIAIEDRKLAALGQIGQGGDLNKAGFALLGAGDVQGGAALLGLGQKAAERDNDAKVLQSIFGSSGASPSTPTPAAPAQMPATTQPIIPGDRSLPRGIRNNNPGNIEAGAFTQGLPGFQGSDGRFARFETPEQGIVAADRLLQSYAGRGLNTVAGIVNRWAPPSENNTGAYVASVARELGVQPDQPLDMASPDVRQKLIAAKIRVENGRQPYGEDVFARAYGRGAPAAPAAPGVQVAETEADVQRLEAQMPGYGGGAAVASVAGDDPVKLRQEAARYQQSNPEAARQFLARAEAAERAGGVQTAQAPSVSQADIPAAGAAQAQGFVIPGTGQVVDQQTLADNPRIQNMIRALGLVKSDEARAAINKRLELEIADAKQRQAVNAPTDVQRNYEMARKQGYQGTFLDYQKELRAQTNVNVDQRGETEEAKAIGQAAGKRAGEAMAAAASGTKQLQRIGQLEALMKNVETGRLQPGRMNLAALGKSLGVNEDFLRGIGLDPAAVGDAQAMQAITGRMVVDMIGSGGFPANNFSDADRAFITGTVPSLANDPRGNKIIMEAARRTAQIDIEKAKAWREWRKDNKSGSFDDFEVQWGERLSSQDRFADLAKQAEAITGPSQPSAGGWQDLGGGFKIRERR